MGLEGVYGPARESEEHEQRIVPSLKNTYNNSYISIFFSSFHFLHFLSCKLGMIIYNLQSCGEDEMRHTVSTQYGEYS